MPRDRYSAALRDLSGLPEKKPASLRTGANDSDVFDVTSLPVYAAGVAPVELPKLGDRDGVLILNGEYGGLLYTLNPLQARPQAGVIGRPIVREAGSGIFGWQIAGRGWGLATLEFYEWLAEEDPQEQIRQMLLWSQGSGAMPPLNGGGSGSTGQNSISTLVEVKEADPAYTMVPESGPGVTMLVQSLTTNNAAQLLYLSETTQAPGNTGVGFPISTGGTVEWTGELWLGTTGPGAVCDFSILIEG